MDGNLDTQKTMDVDLYATLTRATSIFRPNLLRTIQKDQDTNK